MVRIRRVTATKVTYASESGSESIFWCSSLVYFPFLRDGIILATHKKFDAPNHQCKEYVHPSPPHLRRVIENYGITSSETTQRWNETEVDDTYAVGVSIQ